MSVLITMEAVKILAIILWVATSVLVRQLVTHLIMINTTAQVSDSY